MNKKASLKLKDPDHVCSENVKRWRDRIKSYLTDCLEKGVQSGEFIEVPVQETVNMLIALLNGLIRQQVRKMDNLSASGGFKRSERCGSGVLQKEPFDTLNYTLIERIKTLKQKSVMLAHLKAERG